MSTAARIDELRKKFEENPRRYFAPLANEHRKAGDLAQAIALCREFLPKQPGHMSGFIVFGQSLYEAGELEESRSVFEQALSLDPENLIALRHLGDIARSSGDATGARRWYERVLDADPRNDDIAAQLSTLSPVRTPTPVPSQVPSFESIAHVTPPLPMDSIGFAVVPTPDSVMRAVDFDDFGSGFRNRTPIDLDAFEDASQSASAAVPEEAPAEAETPVADLDAFEVPHLDAREPDASDASSAAWRDEDPWAFPGDTGEAETAPAVEATFNDDAATTDAAFEEGLIAADWPDTTELVVRVTTPRSVTPISVTPLSTAALDDAISAFGREPVQPLAAFDEVDEVVTPVAETETDPQFVEPPIAFEATSVEIDAPVTFEAPEAPVAFDAPEALDAPVSFDAPLSFDAPIAFDEPVPFDTPEGFDAPAAFDAITDEMEVPVAFEPTRAEFEASDERDAITDEIPVPAAFDTMNEVESQAAPSELPWLAFSESTAEELDDIESSEPGLEEIAEVFADDARSAGDQGAVTVAALEDPTPSSESESFADVAQAIDEEAATAFEEAVEREVAESLAEMPGAPVPDTSAFVTETMGELLIAQGFLARAVEVYEELVRRRPFDPVLSSRLDELRLMIAPAAEQPEAEALVEESASFADENTAYHTPAHATPSFTQRVTPLVTPLVTPYAQPAVTEEYAPRRSAGEWFAALAARRVPRRTPTQSASAVENSPEGLASLFGETASGHDDAAARALADAFAPVSEQELESGSVLDFEFARATPAFSHTVATPASASVATPPKASTPASFSFDKFFPDPATRRNTPAPSSPAASQPPVTDDLAQFSAWLKGLGNS